MSRLRILLLLIFLLFGSCALVAQKNAWSYFYPIQYTFGYSEKSDAYSGIPNEIISTIAEDELKPPSMIFITLNSLMNIHITTQEGRKSSLRITLGPKMITGNIHYRQFSMAGTMMPDRLTFGCRIQNTDSSSVFELPQVTSQNQPGNESPVLQCRIPHFSSDSDTLVVHHLRFYFDEAALTRFKDRINLINDYYAANAILDTLAEMIKDVDFSLIDHYPSYFIMLEEMNKILTIMKEKNFVQGLNLDSLDPAGFREKFDRISGISVIQSSTFLNKIKMLGTLNLNFSPDTLIRQFLDGVSRYIRWSLLVTERNSTIYQDYLDRYFHLKAFKDDRGVIRDLARIMYPIQNIDSSLARLSRQLYKAYRIRAGDLIKKQQYTEVMELLKNAHNLSEIDPYLKGKVNDRDLNSQAANGIYDALLSVADFAVGDGRQDMARAYISRAQNFKKEHMGFVTSDSLFNKVFKEVTEVLFSKCDTLYSNSRYFEALDCFNNCDKGFDPMTSALIHQRFEHKAQFCRYKILIYDGVDSLVKHDIHEAYRKFFLARQLSQKEHFPPDSLLDSLCTFTFPEYLTPILRSGEERILSNHMDKARKFADSIVSVFRTTGIKCSNEFSEAFARYMMKIEERECRNITESVAVILQRSQRENALKNFILAASSEDTVMMLIEHNPYCLIQYDGLQDTILKYEQAVEFQKMQKNIDHLFMSGQYKKAISGYPEMETCFAANQVSRFGLECIPLYDYIHKKSRPNLTVQVILYYNGKNDLQEAFRYLKLLRAQNYPERSARSCQKILGKSFATKDFNGQPKKDPVLMVMGYCGIDKWMKGFRIGYYSQAGHLRHKPFFTYLFRKWFA